MLPRDPLSYDLIPRGHGFVNGELKKLSTRVRPKWVEMGNMPGFWEYPWSVEVEWSDYKFKTTGVRRSDRAATRATRKALRKAKRERKRMQSLG